MRWFLVDRLVACEPGKRAVGLKAFTRAELFFMDHFPDRPLVPGVLQIEMVAQTAGACIRIANMGVLTLLARVRSAKFSGPISPGDQCRITADVTRLSATYAISLGIVEVDERRVAEVEIMHALVPREGPKQPDPVVDEWIRREET